MISSDPSVWIAAFFTIAIMSYAFRDNIVFEFAEKTFIAAIVGQAVVVGYESLRQFGISQVIAGQYIYIIPIILGFLIFFRYHPQYFWLSRYGTAILVGVGAGLKLRTVPKASIMDQILASVNISQGTALLGIFGAFTTITVLLHFTFTNKQLHETQLRIVPRIGQYLMLIAFGAAFGNTVMTRMNLLIGRLIFLLQDWLGLMLAVVLKALMGG
jgi:uncharacterized membrane protein